MNPKVQRVLSIFIAILIPFFLLMTAIRLLFTPLFLQARIPHARVSRRPVWL